MQRGRRILLLVHLDAFRHDYLEKHDAPFLTGLAKQGGAVRVVPPFGFEPDAAYLAGLAPEESDAGGHFWRAPETSPFRFLRGWGRALDQIPARAQRPVRYAMRSAIQMMSRSPRLRGEATLARIPFAVLPEFDYREKDLVTDLHYPGARTLFEIARELGLPTFAHFHPSHDVRTAAVERRVERELRPEHAFAFLFFGDLDRAGHAHGPDNERTGAVLGAIDASIGRIHHKLTRRWDQVETVILGDHGMASVERAIDILSALRGRGLATSPNILSFIDSTVARFWCTADVRPRLVAALETIHGGRVISAADASKYKIQWRHRRYGDVLFCADGGTIFSPNFWQGDATVRGMHGYLPEVAENHAAIVWHSTHEAAPDGLRHGMDMTSVYPLLVEAMQRIRR